MADALDLVNGKHGTDALWLAKAWKKAVDAAKKDHSKLPYTCIEHFARDLGIIAEEIARLRTAAFEAAQPRKRRVNP